jgi:hypothetical protein
MALQRIPSEAGGAMDSGSDTKDDEIHLSDDKAIFRGRMKVQRDVRNWIKEMRIKC